MNYVTVVISAEGWCEVFASPGIMVRVVEMPPEGDDTDLWERYKEKLMDNLPDCYKDLPPKALGCARGMSWESTADAKMVQDLMKIMDKPCPKTPLF